MKVLASGMLALLMIWMACGAFAQQQMRLYVQGEALNGEQARRLQALLEDEFPQAQWILETGDALGELVMADRAPDLAVCSPGMARQWAREGMLLPLHVRIDGQARIQRQVLESCVEDEALFMLPLMAHHRQMAVNRNMLEEKGLGYFLDREAYPVWMPAQFYQILEEFLLMDEVALDIWHAQADTNAALEALAQAIFGGMLVTQEGECSAGGLNMCGGLRYLADAVDDQMMGYCESRQAALERFLSGETAIFIDWTPQEAKRCAGQMADDQIVCMPYPAAVGMPVRAYTLSGACVFESGEKAKEELALDAAAMLHAKAQEVLGPRGIWRDGSVWLWDLGAHERGATLRSLLCDAFNAVLEGGADPADALADVQAAMDAME